MITKERFEESVDLIRKFLIHYHDDGDDNSLYVRFSEIMGQYEDIQFRLDLYERCTKAIEEHRNEGF